LRRQALETLISQQLILDEADREKIQPDAKDVDAKMKEIAGRFPDAEAFKKMLAAAGLSEKQLRGDVLRNLKIEALLEKKLPKTEAVSEQEVEAFYRDNPEEFKAPERVRASHILITFKPEDDQKERARKRATLEGLKGKIGKGADFAKLAAENSDCPSKSQGGDLGFFGRGQMVKPFEDAAFAMKVNQVSDIVESEFGYHLIKVTGREEAGVVPLKDVRDKLASFLTRQKKQKAVGEHLQKLRSNAKVEYAKGAQS
jgi:peptidyl-prolyl cis-trans isomerase C